MIKFRKSYWAVLIPVAVFYGIFLMIDFRNQDIPAVDIVDWSLHPEHDEEWDEHSFWSSSVPLAQAFVDLDPSTVTEMSPKEFPSELNALLAQVREERGRTDERERQINRAIAQEWHLARESAYLAGVANLRRARFSLDETFRKVDIPALQDTMFVAVMLLRNAKDVQDLERGLFLRKEVALVANEMMTRGVPLDRVAPIIQDLGTYSEFRRYVVGGMKDLLRLKHEELLELKNLSRQEIVSELKYDGAVRFGFFRYMYKPNIVHRWIMEDANEAMDALVAGRVPGSAELVQQRLNEWNGVRSEGVSENILGKIAYVDRYIDFRAWLAEQFGESAVWQRLVWLKYAVYQYEKRAGEPIRTLESLVPMFMEFVPIDPYSGQPLKLDPANRMLFSEGGEARQQRAEVELIPLPTT